MPDPIEHAPGFHELMTHLGRLIAAEGRPGAWYTFTAQIKWDGQSAWVCDTSLTPSPVGYADVHDREE